MANAPKLPGGNLANFLAGYGKARTRAEREIEREVFGTNLGVTSYTTVGQADKLADVLRLGPGMLLLDVGAGRGWPGLYLAAKTGCDAVLTDVPRAALEDAAAGAYQQGLLRTCSVALASGARLPFRQDSFDAAVHTDVL